jgi:FtsP/CotA-like multicopper oxidase with cupredoxin domain
MEKPRVGATEVWEIDSRTGDTHPIHLHLVQSQVLSSDSHHSGSYGGGHVKTFLLREPATKQGFPSLRSVDMPVMSIRPMNVHVG